MIKQSRFSSKIEKSEMPSSFKKKQILISTNSHNAYKLTQVQMVLLNVTINSACRV